MSFVKMVAQQKQFSTEQDYPFLALGLFEGKGLDAYQKPVDEAVGGLISAVIERGDFRGKAKDTLVLHTSGNPTRVALIGLGKEEDFSGEKARQAAGKASTLARKQRQSACALLAFETGLDGGEVAQGLAEGLILGSYQYDDMKNGEEDDVLLESLAVVGDLPDEGIARGQIIANGVAFARDLQNSPANVVTPSRLAAEAKRIAEADNVRCTVFDREEFTKLGMGALAGVALGTNEPPKFILMEYHGGKEGDAPIAIVGKGLTFDAGGICIKPSAKMDEMKFDMSGGAAVLGIMQAVSELQPKLNIVAAVPSTENLLGGSAQRPGDIVKAYNGKTIEVINTDAEGRLILADALSFVVEKYKPSHIMNFATLTGAVLIALGHRASGLMGNNDEFIEEVKGVAETTGERVWQLPLWEEYREDIKSKVADIKNVGEGRLAGTIAGGIFLKEFVADTPWVHIDIAGTAWQDKDQPYTPGGGSGVVVRLVTALLLGRASS